MELGTNGKQKNVYTKNTIITLGAEPLCVEYDTSDWFGMRSVGGSVIKVGLPHNMPVTDCGLSRTVPRGQGCLMGTTMPRSPKTSLRRAHHPCLR